MICYLSVFELDVACLLLVAVVILHVTLVGHGPPEEGATRGAGLTRRLASFKLTNYQVFPLCVNVKCSMNQIKG